MQTASEAEFFDTQGLADFLSVPVSTVRDWRYRRVGPPGVRVGGHVRYRRCQVEAWLREQAENDPRRPAA